CRRCDNLPSTCASGFDPVDPQACGPEAGCVQILTCEGYVSCAPQSSECTEEPACPEGFDPVDACTDETPECEVIDVCDQELACAPTPDACTEPPACPEGFEPLEACTDEHPTCELLDICGVTLACLPPAGCEPASCP